jgi:8-oxo-dGTP pyrophosphatase MutT (NUDIX family)
MPKKDFTTYYSQLNEQDLLQCASGRSLLFPENRNMQIPDGADPVNSSVVLLCFPKFDALHLLFIRRSKYNGVHSGQIAFPGGRFDAAAGDADIRDTAIRETFEETAVVLQKERILASLSSLYVPPSNFLIQPFVYLLDDEPNAIPAPREVEEIIEVPLDFLLNASCVGRSAFDTIYGTVTAPCYIIDELTKIWGATAIILSEFLCLERNRMGDGR